MRKLTEHDDLTYSKSKRLIENFVYNHLFVDIGQHRSEVVKTSQLDDTSERTAAFSLCRQLRELLVDSPK